MSRRALLAAPAVLALAVAAAIGPAPTLLAGPAAAASAPPGAGPGVGAEAPVAPVPLPGRTVEDDTALVPFRRPSPDVLARRRRELLDSLGTGVALLRSSSPKDIEGDYPQASDFRQNNDFLYFTGLETPDSWLLLSARAGGGAAEILFVPERDPSEEQWTGKRPGPRKAGRISGIENVRTTAEFERMVREGRISAFAGDAPLHVPLNDDALDDPLLRRLAAKSSPQVRDVEPVVARLRLVKGDFERRMLRRAVGLTDRAIRAALRAARPGMYEYQLEAIVEYELQRGGAERVAFPSIVGSGPNSVILHYDESRRRTRKGDVVVMDVGAEYSYYAADVTRTFPVDGTFSDRQRELYELVLGAQEAALGAVRPGNRMADVSKAARAYLREHSDGLCGKESCEEFFSHGVGHWLGMDVHDVGSYSTPFRPGMVLTVEPGVYLAEEELGIRIEDDVLVTEDGHRVLSGAPKTVEAVERAMARERSAAGS